MSRVQHRSLFWDRYSLVAVIFIEVLSGEASDDTTISLCADDTKIYHRYAVWYRIGSNTIFYRKISNIINALHISFWILFLAHKWSPDKASRVASPDKSLNS